MMGVIGSEPGGIWVKEQFESYRNRRFIVNGKEDLTTNVNYITGRMRAEGFVPNGLEQEFKSLHVFPVEYFSPRMTTGEYNRTEVTYCEHKGFESSWAKQTMKGRILSLLSPAYRTALIKLKRRIFG